MSSSGTQPTLAGANASSSSASGSARPAARSGPTSAQKPSKTDCLKDSLLTVIVLASLAVMTLFVAIFVSIIATNTMFFGYELHEIPIATKEFGRQLIRETVPSEWIPEIGREGSGFKRQRSTVGPLDYHKLAEMSAEKLAIYDGNGPHELILLSITGLIFNVSSAPNFYGKGGGYNFFSGKDATVSFVTGCFSDECFANQSTGWDAMDADSARQVNEWVGTYIEKYHLYARLKDVYEQYHTDNPFYRRVKYYTPIDVEAEQLLVDQRPSHPKPKTSIAKPSDARPRQKKTEN